MSTSRRNRTERRAAIAFALLFVTGCGAILGIEDIQTESADAAAPEAGTEASNTDAPDVVDAAPFRCAFDAPIMKQTRLDALVGDPKGGEIWPRISRDELTIVFGRQTPSEGALFVPFIARRRSRSELFGDPIRIDPSVAPAFAAITADASRLFFSQGVAQGVGGNRALRTALVTDGPLVAKSIAGLGDDTDSVFPFPLEETNELYFTRAAKTTELFAIYRARGSGETFTTATEVTSIETLRADAGRVMTYEEPVLSADGTRLYFTARSALPNGTDLQPWSTYVAVRTDTTRLDFEPPILLPDFSQTTRPSGIGGLSPDECRLYTYRQSDDGRFRLYIEERAR